MSFVASLLRKSWVRYLLTVVLLLLVVFKIEPQHLVHAAGSVGPGYLAAALTLTLPFLYLKALRWHWMLHAADVDAEFGEAALSLLGGMGLALITPGRLGELVRVAYLHDPQKLKIGGLVMIDKGFDVLALSGLSVAGAWLLVGPAAGVAMAAVTCAGLAIVFLPGHLLALLHTIGSRIPFGRTLVRAAESLRSLSVVNSTLFLVLTLASFAIVLLQFGVILLSWRHPSVDIVFLTFPLVILTNVLPVTIGGLGVREVAAAALLSHYGVPGAEAALAAFLMFAINTAIPGLVGAFLLPAMPGSRPVADPSKRI